MTGPPIEGLLRRLVDTPRDFLAPPALARRTGSTIGRVDVAAVVADTLHHLGAPALTSEAAERFRPRRSTANENWLRCVLIACWLLAYFDPETGPDDDRSLDHGRLGLALPFLADGLVELAGLVEADRLVADPERREELSRLLLRDLGLTPRGETDAQAADRLATLDSVNRERVLSQARAAERRAAEVRRALESKRAAEAAAKASRE